MLKNWQWEVNRSQSAVSLTSVDTGKEREMIAYYEILNASEDEIRDLNNRNFRRLARNGSV
jgi:hypothetical protein